MEDKSKQTFQTWYCFTSSFIYLSVQHKKIMYLSYGIGKIYSCLFNNTRLHLNIFHKMNTIFFYYSVCEARNLTDSVAAFTLPAKKIPVACFLIRLFRARKGCGFHCLNPHAKNFKKHNNSNNIIFPNHVTMTWKIEVNRSQYQTS